MLSCFIHVQFFTTLWSIAYQAPLSMGFSRQEYWSGLPFPLLGGFSQPRCRIQASYISCIGRQVLYHWWHLGSPATLFQNLQPLQIFLLLQSLLLCLAFLSSCILSLVAFVYLPRLYLASSCPHPEKLLLFLLSSEHRVEARQLQFPKPQSNPSLQWDSPFPHHQSFSF